MKRRIVFWLGIIAEFGPAVCIAVLCVMGCIIRLFFDKDFILMPGLIAMIAMFILLTPVGILLVLFSTDWKEPISRRRGIAPHIWCC